MELFENGFPKQGCQDSARSGHSDGNTCDAVSQLDQYNAQADIDNQAGCHVRQDPVLFVYGHEVIDA